MEHASAQEGQVYFASYIGLNVHDGMEFADSTSGQSGDFDYEDSTSFAGALGIKYESNLRLEAEISYRTSDADRVNFDGGAGAFPLGGELETLLTMFNAYYDFDVDMALQPFITGGIGIAWSDLNIDDSSGFIADTANDDISFAWQVGTGLRYQLSPDVSMSGGYRYLDSSDLEIGGFEIDYSAHEFRFGLEYALPAY